MIDQGFDTMEGTRATTDLQPHMRTYMRAGLVCGVLGDHLRGLGFGATAHSAADSDVIQTPLVLLVGWARSAASARPSSTPSLGPTQQDRGDDHGLPIRPKPIDFGLQTSRVVQQVRARMPIGRDLRRPQGDVQRLRDPVDVEKYALPHDQPRRLHVRALHEGLP